MMDSTRRQFIAGIAALPLAPTSTAAAALSDVVTPEMFGALGDGRTNDTSAFAAMSAHVNSRGGGTIVFRRAVYIVGRQFPGRSHRESFAAADIIHLAGCTGPVSIRGNGAVLRLASGLRYGRFEPGSGRPLPDPIKLDLGGTARPYTGMIHIEKCSGAIDISDLELDGNLASLIVGGRASRGGWQAAGSGIRLIGNSGPEKLSRILTHHHAQDGLILAPAQNRAGWTTVTDLVSEHNGRQGCSITGGTKIYIARCKFRHTGRNALRGSPGAGVDIEAENSAIRNVAFEECEFADNAGFGLVSGSGDSADIRLTRSRFIGTTNWAAWPDSPGMRFDACQFVGAINHAHGDADPARAAQFSNCTFTDDPALSPTGRVFLSPGSAPWIAIVLKRPNVRFAGCKFRLVDRGVLPLSSVETIYADCDMSQRSEKYSGPVGTYVGTNNIVGNARLEGSVIRGDVVLNGRRLPRTP